MTGFPAFRISVLRSSEVTLLSKSRAAAKKPLSEHAWGNREHQSTDLGGVRDHGSLVQANQRSVRGGVAVWPHDSVGQELMGQPNDRKRELDDEKMASSGRTTLPSWGGRGPRPT